MDSIKKPGRNGQVATQGKSPYAVAARHAQTQASLISLELVVSFGDATALALYSGQRRSKESLTIAAA